MFCFLLKLNRKLTEKRLNVTTIISFFYNLFFFGRVLNKEIKNGDYYSIFTHVKR